jgi:hypothetical protein
MEFGMSYQKVEDQDTIAKLNALRAKKVTDQDTIAKLNALRAKKEQPEGFLSKLPKNIFAGGVKGGQKTVEELNDLQNAFTKFGQGITKNVPNPAMGMYKEQHLKPLADYVPKIPDVNKALGMGKLTAADKLIQGSITYAPEIMGGIQLIKAASKIPGYLSANKRIKVQQLQELLEKSGLDAEQAAQALHHSELESKHTYNVKDPESLQYKLNEHQKNPLLQQDVNRPLDAEFMQGPESPVIPEEPNLPQEHEYKSLTQYTKPGLGNAAQNLEHHTEALKQHLGEGQLHHERFGTALSEEREKLENANKKSYSKVDKSLENKKVVIKEPKEAGEILNEVAKTIGNEGTTSEEFHKLLNEAMEKNQGESIPAKDFLTAYRTARRAGNDAYWEVKEYGGTERGENAYKKMQKLKQQTDKMYKMLEQSMGKEDFKLLEGAQKEFREKIAPMRENSTFRAVEKKGKVKDVLEQTVGTETGVDVLRDIIYKNPEMMRLAVGQKYAKTPHLLHEKNEQLEKHFFPRMQKLKELKENHATAIKEHEDAVSLHNEAIVHDKEQQKIADKIKKDRESIANSHEKEKSSLQKKYEADKKKHAKDKEEAITKEKESREKERQSKEKLTATIQDLEERIPNLRAKAENKKYTLEQHMKAQKELDKALDELHKLRALSRKVGKIAIKVIQKSLKI